jgi:hypothetical protein
LAFLPLLNNQCLQVVVFQLPQLHNTEFLAIGAAITNLVLPGQERMTTKCAFLQYVFG